MRENRSLLVRDVTTDPDYIAVAPDVRAQLVALVRRGGQVLGALSLECGQVDGFSQEDVDFAEHLAEHAAIAVDNARRYERERRQNEVLTRRAAELAGILRIGNALKADLALSDVLSQIAEGVRTSLGFNIAVLNLVQDGPPAVLVRAASAGLDPATWARLQAQVTTVEEAQQLLDPRFQISESYFISHLYNPATGFQSYYRPPREPRPDQEWQPDDMLIVPLRGKGGRLVGTLSVDDPTDGQLPSRATIETLEIFANQAVISIENARLFDDQRERLRELTLLQDLGVRISAKLDPTELLHEVACAAVQLFDVRAAAVYLTEDPANLRAATGSVSCHREGKRAGRAPLPARAPRRAQRGSVGGRRAPAHPGHGRRPAAGPALRGHGLPRAGGGPAVRRRPPAGCALPARRQRRPSSRSTRTNCCRSSPPRPRWPCRTRASSRRRPAASAT